MALGEGGFKRGGRPGIGETRDEFTGKFPFEAFECSSGEDAFGRVVGPTKGWNISSAKPDSSVSRWNPGTSYTSFGELVEIGGIQFSCLETSGNIEKNPLTNPDYWISSPPFDVLVEAYNSGRPHYGMNPIHNYNGSYYHQYFPLGAFSVSSLTMMFYGVHLDGSAVGSGALSAVVETWFLKDLLAPGSTGSRILVDARNRVLRAMGETGGVAPTLGAVQGDAFQGHFHAQLITTSTVSGSNPYILRNNASGTNPANLTSSPSSDGVNGTPRTSTETRVKALIVGVPYVVIAVSS